MCWPLVSGNSAFAIAGASGGRPGSPTPPGLASRPRDRRKYAHAFVVRDDVAAVPAAEDGASC
jgi:hypothetical protein